MSRPGIATRSAAILLPVAILLASPVMTGAASAKTVTPQVCSTQSGYRFDNLVNQGLILDGKGTPKILHNGSKNPETLTFTQTASGTVQWSVNGSITATGSYDFEVIKASVALTIGGSYTSSKTVSETVTVQMSVPVGDYGILQGGAFRRKVTGHYYYMYGNCTHTAGSTITVKLPFPNQGYDTTVNTTGKVPWDQQ